MKIIYLGNFKGGVGKTTVTAALAYVLTQEFGKRVLMLDADPQGNLTGAYKTKEYVRAYMADEPVPDTCDLFEYIDDDEKLDDFYIQTDYENLYLIPTWKYDLSGVLKDAEKAPAKEFHFKNFVKQFREDMEAKFDYLLIDSPPSKDSVATINALMISERRIGILSNDKDSLDALDEFHETYIELMKAIRRYKNKDNISPAEYALDAVIVNQIDDKTNFSGDFIDYIESKEHYTNLYIKPYIHHAVAITELKIHLEGAIKKNKRAWQEFNGIAKSLLKKGVL